MINTINVYFEELDRELGPAAQATAIGAGGIAFMGATFEFVDFGNSSIVSRTQNGNIHTQIVNPPADIDTLSAVGGLTGAAAIFLGTTLLAATGIKYLKQRWADK